MYVGLKRQTFTTSRELEYFSESELSTQTGYNKALWWPQVIAKELIDNSLDACEQAGITPALSIHLTDDFLEISDNGPGIQAAVVNRILDFSTRTSDKQAYISPTRGAQGNALKTVLAIPYVLNGGKNVSVEICARGLRHLITISTDAIARKPRIQHESSKIVRTGGTTFRVPANSTGSKESGASPQSLQNLICNYALFNPHATFALNDQRTDGTDPGWRKWLPTDPTSASWYNLERFGFLVASCLAMERNGCKPRTVRDFVSEFRGLSATAKQAKVTETSGLGRAYLQDLASDGEFDQEALGRLLDAMKRESQPVKPEMLGVLGQDHFRQRIAHDPNASGDTFRYSRQKGFDEGDFPYLVECAFAVVDWNSPWRGLRIGLNWSIPLGQALQQNEFEMEEGTVVEGLTAALAENRIDIHNDPICMAVHLTCPRFAFLDRGKGSVVLSNSFSDALAKAVAKVTKPWAKIKKHQDREQRQSAADSRDRYFKRTHRISIRDVAFEVIPEAYMKASGGGRYPANARQIMYAARPAIQENTGRRLDDKYFTQVLLPDYLNTHSESDDWDVIYDARGHLEEPHSGKIVGIGTSEVKDYLYDEKSFSAEIELPDFKQNAEDIRGPERRYGALLYIEKEGFMPLLREARIPERYDLALASSKGLSSTAARELIEGLSGRVMVLALHDFDKAGFSIVGTLQRDTRRYRFEKTPEIIDLGLRLEDVRKWNLQAEDAYLRGRDPACNLHENGATEKEIKFLRKKRVELNAFTSDDFIEWLEGKLDQHKVHKVIPDLDTLGIAYRSIEALRLCRQLIRRHNKEIVAQVEKLRIPRNLRGWVAKRLKEYPEKSWDVALSELNLDQDGANTRSQSHRAQNPNPNDQENG